MRPNEGRDLVTILELLDAHPQEAQQRMVQYLVSKVGMMPTLAREYERQRKADQRDVQELVRDTVRDSVSGTGAYPDMYVNGASSSPGSKKKNLLLTQEGLDKAKSLLSAADFDFLAACPEPFRTAWLIDAEWWVSLRDGYPKINAQQQASRYMAWPGAKRKKDHRAALRNWFSTADRWRERDEQRKAVRG